MIKEARRIGELSGGREVYQVDSYLDRQINSLCEVGIKSPYFVDVRGAAEIRLEEISSDSTITSIVSLAVKDNRTILCKDSSFMYPFIISHFKPFELVRDLGAREAYALLNPEFYKNAEVVANNQEGMKPEDRTAIILPFDGNGVLTQDMDVTRFLFGGQLINYFEKFVRNGEISFWNLEGNSDGSTTANYAWLRSPSKRNLISCCGFGIMGCDYLVSFGILD